jgi:hypothetical protein
LVEGDVYYMNVSSNDCDLVLFVELLDIHSFFMTNLLNFSMYFFLLSQGVHKIVSRITIQSKYWSSFIKYEESVLASLRWYNNVVFIRERVFPPSDAFNVQKSSITTCYDQSQAYLQLVLPC